MGQSLDTMARNQHSKEEVLCQMVRAGNVEAIKALCTEGANLEWIDKEGKTPLIVACMDFGLFNVAKALIELGANVNAYRPGRNAGTPLHHAAKRGLHQTLNLLLSSGANAFVRNDNCRTALDVARTKEHLHVVRTIENHICYFSGWLREFYGPGFLEALAPRFVSSKIWVVVIPCGYNNQVKQQRLQLVIYPTFQDILPRTVISLWKAKIEEPKFDHSDPHLIIFDHSNRTRYKFASATTGDKQQLHWLYDACRGISQTLPSTQHFPENGVESVGHETSAEATELALAISPSIRSATDDRPAVPNALQISEEISANGWENSLHPDNHNAWEPAGPTHSVASSSGWMDEAAQEDGNGWGVSNSGSTSNQGGKQNPDNPPNIVQASESMAASVPLTPSAPPIPYEDDGTIHYPSTDSSPVDWSVPAIEREAQASVPTDLRGEGQSSSCIICWEAPVEGACVPCGHMGGCMRCLNEIKAKKGLCPVCQTELAIARTKGHLHIVRTIENHICYFSGWLREFYGPGFLEALAPQFVSSKIWVVVIPCGYNSQVKQQRLQLVIYPTLQDIQPRTVISLWKAKIEEPKFDHSDPQLIILDPFSRTRYKFASATTGDKQQLHWLYDACRGVSQFTLPPTEHASENGVESVGRETSAEAVEREAQASATTDLRDDGQSSSCVICWEAPVEGACVPCGHMAGCMKCLNEIKAKKGPCPLCRANLNEVMRVYAV